LNKARGWKVSNWSEPWACAQALRHLVLLAQLLVHAGHRTGRLWQRGAAVDPGRDGVVGELGLVAHQGPIDGGLHDRRVACDHHLADQRQPVLVGIERCEVGAQPLGQHRKHLGRGVDRRGVDPGMLVDRRALLHHRVHVGPGHAQPDLTVGKCFAGRQLVEVERIVVVERTPGQRGQIADVRIGVPARAGDRRQLLQQGRRKSRFQAAFAHGVGGDANQVDAIACSGRVHGVPRVGVHCQPKRCR